VLSNIGKVDRLIRTAASFLIAFGSIYWGAVLGILGIVILLTAIISWCPIYALLQLSTTKEQEEIPPNTSGEHEPHRGPRRLLK
jgi:hypothetical protein